MCPSENWKKIENFPDYAVSDLGRIKRLTAAKNNFCKPGRILKTRIEKNGYERVNLYVCGSVKRVSVHRLVAISFLGKPPTEKHEVGHINGIRNDNRLGNLKWCTKKQNHKDKIKHGTRQCGQNNGMSKLSAADVFFIRSSKCKLDVLAAYFGVSKNTICGIRTGRLRKYD